jgi:hypothetical protein
MDSNKFLNMKSEYKTFVKECASQIKKINIETELTKEKCVEIFKLYQSINSQIESSSSININDVNHIILNYNREDKDVELLKKFVKIKNLYLIKTIIKSPLWEPFILKLTNELDLDDPKLNKKITNHLVSKGVYRLLNQTNDYFSGCWEIAEIKDDKVKKLEIIEPEHYEYLIKYLKTKLKE